MSTIIHIIKHIIYLLTSKHRNGFGVHSPFAFKLITEVISKKEKNVKFNQIEKIRKKLLKSNEKIIQINMGAGSQLSKSKSRKIKSIVKFSSVNIKYGRLLFRIVDYFKPKTIIELGTSLGISTAYLACASSKGKVLTIEGCPETAKLAKEHFAELGIKNIKLSEGSFDTILPCLLENIKHPLLIFFDGNHTKKATLQYFNICLKHITNNSVFIFDDIHWSEEMEKAWIEIKKNSKVKVTFDLFRLGLVFFNKELQKQDYIIKF